MNYSIRKEDGAPAYMQLYEQLRRDIAHRALPSGARLPSKRLLAEETGVSVITVEHAYALLCDEGYAEPRERSGYYVAFGETAGAAEAPRLSAPRLGTAEIQGADSDFPFTVWARTMRRVLSEYDRRILDKAPLCGCAELRAALAAYLLRSRGIEVSPERIIVGAGAEYLYSLVAQLVGRDRLMALEEPCYEKIRQVYLANGASCVRLKLGERGILSAPLQDCRAGLLHVTPFHSYPSGVTASAAKRREYARWAKERDAYIVEDDYDSEFASVTKRIETIYSLAPERVIYINTFTRTIAPAMRMGYMVLPESLMREYRERLGFYSCTVPVFEQLVLAEFIDCGELERHINRRRRKLRHGACQKSLSFSDKLQSVTFFEET